MNAPDGSRNIVYNFLCCRSKVTINDDALLKMLSISIKIHVVIPLCSVSKLSTESVGSRRELVANPCNNNNNNNNTLIYIAPACRMTSEALYTPPTPTRRDPTVESRRRRRCVLGISRKHCYSFDVPLFAYPPWTHIPPHTIARKKTLSGDIFGYETGLQGCGSTACIKIWEKIIRDVSNAFSRLYATSVD